jgi:hypothetical protein
MAPKHESSNANSTGHCPIYDTAQHNTAQHDTTRHDTTRHDTTRHDTTRHDTTRHDTTRHDTTRHDTTRHDTTRHDTTRHDTTRHDTTHLVAVAVKQLVELLNLDRDISEHSGVGNGCYQQQDADVHALDVVHWCSSHQNHESTDSYRAPCVPLGAATHRPAWMSPYPMVHRVVNTK